MFSSLAFKMLLKIWSTRRVNKPVKWPYTSASTYAPCQLPEECFTWQSSHGFSNASGPTVENCIPMLSPRGHLLGRVTLAGVKLVKKVEVPRAVAMGPARSGTSGALG